MMRLVVTVWSFEESYQARVTSFVERLSLRAALYAPESLDEMEELCLDRVPGPEVGVDAETRELLLDVLRYVGETLLRSAARCRA